MIGRTLDHYRIEAKLGEGGMGVVYKAVDIHLGRLVAIKVLPADKIADAGRKQRFEQEARAASALNHPNIVTIYDIRSEDGVDFIVMEYIEGRTLDALIASKPMRPAQALRYGTQIADALATAHAAGILHRDLKPSNVIVTVDGRAKLLDFGLAKLLEPSDSSPDELTLTARALTEEGAVVGTAAYMSPEQAEGRRLDARSDIFSFGAVLYEMTTGQKPFQGTSRISILNKIVNHDPTPPSEVSTAIPVETEKIVLRCLRKDPARRYQTAADLKVALEDAAEEPASVSQRRRVPWARRWFWVAMLPFIPFIAYFISLLRPRPENTEPLRAIPLTTQPGVQRYPSFSPDGNHVAFTWTGPKQDNPDIYVLQIGSAGDPLRVTADASNDYSPVWSPDGRWIAFLRSQSEAGKSELRLVPPLGGPERKLADIHVRGGTWVTPPYVAWCPRSDCLVVTDSSGAGKPDALFRISLESGERQQLTRPAPPALGDTNPAISPDGNWLVFRRSFSLYAGELNLLALSSDVTTAGEPMRLTTAALDAKYPAWMPGSTEILFSARDGLRRLVAAGGKPGEGARLPYVGEDGVMPAISRETPQRPARLVYVRSFDDFNIWRIEIPAEGAPAASPPALFISSTRGDWFPQFSPDGRRIVFASNRSGDGGIWVADAEGSNTTQLASLGTFATGGPRWSPDGEQIAFHTNIDGQPEVYRVAASGGKPRNLTSHPANDAFPSFSHDGKWIYFSSSRDSTVERRIWKMPASGGEAVAVPNTVGYVPLESPDGNYLYFVETMNKPSALWRVPISGGVPEKVLEGVVLGNYIVREQGIYYIDRPAGEGGVYYLDKPTGETRLMYFAFATRRSSIVARNLGTVDLFLTASPDGRTILYSRMDSSVDDLMLVENFR